MTNPTFDILKFLKDFFKNTTNIFCTCPKCGNSFPIMIANLRYGKSDVYTKYEGMLKIIQKIK